MAKKIAKRKTSLKKPKMNLFQLSWFILKENPVLFLPNILLLISNLILFLCLIKITGISSAVLNNNYGVLKESIFSSWFIITVIGYFIVTLLIDNYFITAKYGLIKQVLLKGHAKFSDGLKFAKKYYLTTIGIHVISFLIVFVPLLILAALLFLLLPFSKLVAISIFIPLAVIYFLYISIRLIFVYPVMTFESDGAYTSLKENFHFVKTHLHHTLLTWLIVMGVSIFISIFRENLIEVQSMLHQQLVLIGFLLIAIIIVVEIAVSVWEQIFIFKSYLAARKPSKSKTKKKR
jgi:hypothetical protein